MSVLWNLHGFHRFILHEVCTFPLVLYISKPSSSICLDQKAPLRTFYGQSTLKTRQIRNSVEFRCCYAVSVEWYLFIPYIIATTGFWKPKASYGTAHTILYTTFQPVVTNPHDPKIWPAASGLQFRARMVAQRMTQIVYTLESLPADVSASVGHFC